MFGQNTAENGVSLNNVSLYDVSLCDLSLRDVSFYDVALNDVDRTLKKLPIVLDVRFTYTYTMNFDSQKNFFFSFETIFKHPLPYTTLSIPLNQGMSLVIRGMFASLNEG